MQIKNYKTFGYDNDKRKIKNLKKNKSPISYISNKKYFKNKKKTFYNNNFNNVNNCDILIICLPTPLNLKNEPDLSDIKNCIFKLQKIFKKGTNNNFRKYNLSRYN